MEVLIAQILVIKLNLLIIKFTIDSGIWNWRFIPNLAKTLMLLKKVLGA